MKKKIVLMVTYCTLAVIIGTLVTLSLISYNVLPKFNNPTSIELHQTGSTINLSPGDNYDEFMDIYNNSFSESLLSAMFSGKLSNDYDVNVTTLSTTEPYVKLIYSTSQTLKHRGKVVKNPTNTSKNVVFDAVYMNVNEENHKSSLTIYLMDSLSGTTTIYSIIIEANTSKLYDFVLNY